ncbi:MAG TPA: hypothetical protein VM689_12415 [Aliidongia sp.]|nr:hypothetical protein [Aliidongia sp.]
MSVAFAAYVAMAFLAGRAELAKLELSPGQAVELDVVRLARAPLRFELEFQRHGGKVRPASPVRIRAEHGEAAPVLYEAMPVSGWNETSDWRAMTPNFAAESGVWPRPGKDTALSLRPGFDKVRFVVTDVDDALKGEIVTLLIVPPLALKTCQPATCPLAPWLWLWPIFLAGQAAWGLWLVYRSVARP